jgi:hypothetical protein
MNSNQHEFALQQAINLELRWIDGGRIPAVMNQYDAQNFSKQFGVAPAGRWIWGYCGKISRFELAYHVTTHAVR